MLTSVHDRLEAVQVTRAFAGLRAVDEVSLSVARGEIVGLIGPNGSGKTTLLNVLSGVLRPTAGIVRIGGDEITGKPAHLCSAAGVCRTFQNIRLFGELTVRENVEVGVLGSRTPPRWGRLRSAADEFLEAIGIGDLHDRVASTLPYGAQRRLEIARALATRPRFLLLDEPAAGMNDAESDDLLASVRAIRDRFELGLVVVEHDLRLILRLCDRIAVLNQGHLIAEGPPRAIRADEAVIEAYLGRAAAEGTRSTHTEGAS